MTTATSNGAGGMSSSAEESQRGRIEHGQILRGGRGKVAPRHRPRVPIIQCARIKAELSCRVLVHKLRSNQVESATHRLVLNSIHWHTRSDPKFHYRALAPLSAAPEAKSRPVFIHSPHPTAIPHAAVVCRQHSPLWPRRSRLLLSRTRRHSPLRLRWFRVVRSSPLTAAIQHVAVVCRIHSSLRLRRSRLILPRTRRHPPICLRLFRVAPSCDRPHSPWRSRLLLSRTRRQSPLCLR